MAEIALRIGRSFFDGSTATKTFVYRTNICTVETEIVSSEGIRVNTEMRFTSEFDSFSSFMKFAYDRAITLIATGEYEFVAVGSTPDKVIETENELSAAIARIHQYIQGVIVTKLSSDESRPLQESMKLLGELDEFQEAATNYLVRSCGYTMGEPDELGVKVAENVRFLVRCVMYLMPRAKQRLNYPGRPKKL